MKYPAKLDNNVTRVVALIMFITTLLTIIVPELRFLAILMLADFILRYVHPKYSLIAKSGIYISREMLKRPPMPRISGPKRFSLLIGVIFTFFMSITYFMSFGNIIYLTFALPLLFAIGLLAFFDICLGCIVYDYLMKIGLFQSQSIDNFLSDSK